ncbi:MAG: DNA mismatch repair endonuclease MutL [Deltaproteobacteria bacterium]|nr:DNA mismatch repair endonuclease MutL [Deltaproteobacteria bacterium]
MGKIKILPEKVVNKIAAGEVIERPASVLKELIENSLDAQAQNISVIIKHGGRELIRVTDNGEGMGREDAEHSLKRHATSKIEVLEDIFQIRSFGFRGEALPSIAACSRLTLLTRESGAELGTEIKVAGGSIESTREAGTAKGTTVEVADLFFNTPARRKFLRTERAEFIAIVESLTTFSLGNPTVDFRLVKDNKLSIDYPSCVSLRERIAQIHDKDVVQALIPIKDNTSEINISGFITSPEVTRVNRTGQYFYINNRPIKSPALSFALHQGFEETLPANRHPMAFLFFSIESSRVDVNVHPNKREVRLTNEREVQKLLMETIRVTLHTKRRFPKVHLLNSRKKEEGLDQDSGGRVSGFTYPESNGSLALSRIHETPPEFSCPEKSKEAVTFNLPAAEQPLRFEEKGEDKISKILGQFQSTYIIAENDGKLLVIDQHAAHERIMYEKILDTLMNAQSPAQLQLIPITFSLDYREQEILEEYLPILEQIGFGINNLGRNTYCLDATPTFLDSEDSKQLLLDFIHDAMEGHPPRSFEDKKKALAASIACKSKSVKASSRLLPEKMEHLVKSLFQAKQPFTCPHGRPTCITLTNEDLGKHFGRK